MTSERTSIDGEGEFSDGHQLGGGTAVVEEAIEEMYNEATEMEGMRGDQSIDDESQSSD